MDVRRLNDLLDRYHKGGCTAEELKEIEQWYTQLGDSSLKAPMSSDPSENEAYLHNQYQYFEARIKKDRPTSRILPILKAAAVLVLIIGGSLLFLLFRNQGIQKPETVLADIGPGGDHATLTLPDGKTMQLDSIKNGNIALMGNQQAIKTGNGSLIYNDNGSSTETLAYNILATPRGGKYMICLPDGTKVWLNAATSLRFPVAFSRKERRVEVIGEAYFEIAPDPQRPFFVSSGSQVIKVLGTHFNVSAYAEEKNITTTLLQGRVMVNTQKDGIMLSPGQAAVFENGKVSSHTADIEQAVAWKDGILDMNGQSLEEVMRKIARWYDVEIIYQNQIPTKILSGQMDRELKLSELVQGLRTMGLDIKMEGKKLIINS
ncbi:FecR family protein [Chryseobacterium populi]|uniref:Fe2+-dicitrate sensor, membrane component n=1 Tax=Chryseobacterium populi TaxID=1144316 RepID=J3CM24_9FLAO|nr:FecR family protein [Chryseobacterium populi]EJL74384.1 Fe2+-dicitrate sensor, membrane component [Chryseobacterium populi]